MVVWRPLKRAETPRIQIQADIASAGVGLVNGGSLPVLANAQFGSFGDIPVEITADGETRFEGGVAIAEDNVQIHYGEVGIYTSYAESYTNEVGNNFVSRTQTRRSAN
jgi:hypothetical protein